VLGNRQNDAAARLPERFHDEQIQIWASELLEHFMGNDQLVPTNDYEEILDLNRVAQAAVRDLLDKATASLSEGN